MVRSFRGNLAFVLAISSNAAATIIVMASRQKTGVPIAVLVSGCAVLSIIAILAGMRGVHRSVSRLDRHIAAAKNGMAEADHSPKQSRYGLLSRLAEGIDGFLTHIKGSLVAVKNLWRKNFELSQDMRSNAQAISEEIQVVSRSSDLLEITAAKLDEKITDSKRTVDAMQRTLEKADAVSVDQAAAMEESSAAIEELISSIHSIAGISEEKRAALDRLVVTVERSRSEIHNTIDAFASISESTGSILDLATVISEIAEQTNLLSMNAAIEAAHAGDQGKGFAVVAGEIKKLAESSRKNSTTITGTLKGIRAGIDQSLSTSSVLKGSMEEVLGSVRETTSSMGEIISGMTEMSAGTAQISTALSTLVETAEESKKNTAEILETSRQLQEHIGEIEINSQSNVAEVKTITRSVHRISNSLQLLSTISDDNAKNLTVMRDKLETIPTGKRFVCDYLPPYQYIAEDRITGVFTEIVELLLAELHEEASIEFMPWGEAIAKAQSEPGIFLLTALRTAQREKQFRWIGPVVPDKHYMFRLSGRSDIVVHSSGDLKNYRLGSVANNYSYKYFTDNGVPEQKIKTVNIHSMNIQNLLLGEVDMIPMSTLQLTHQLEMMNRDMEFVTAALEIDAFPTDAYLAVSLSTPEHVFKKYEEGFEQIRKSRRFEEILRKYKA